MLRLYAGHQMPTERADGVDKLPLLQRARVLRLVHKAVQTLQSVVRGVAAAAADMDEDIQVINCKHVYMCANKNQPFAGSLVVDIDLGQKRDNRSHELQTLGFIDDAAHRTKQRRNVQRQIAIRDTSAVGRR